MAAGVVVDEERTLIAAALKVLRRKGSEGMTVADVLTEAGLSTRAFYRHFASKDALILAVYAHDARRVKEQVENEIAAASSPRAALELWINAMLALAFDARRAARTKPLAREGARLRAEYPKEFDAIVDSGLEPLIALLERFPDANPVSDAHSIYAITWALASHELGARSDLTMDEARAQVLRFCLPAIGADE